MLLPVVIVNVSPDFIVNVESFITKTFAGAVALSSKSQLIIITQSPELGGRQEGGTVTIESQAKISSPPNVSPLRQAAVSPN